MVAEDGVRGRRGCVVARGQCPEGQFVTAAFKKGRKLSTCEAGKGDWTGTHWQHAHSEGTLEDVPGWGGLGSRQTLGVHQLWGEGEKGDTCVKRECLLRDRYARAGTVTQGRMSSSPSPAFLKCEECVGAICVWGMCCVNVYVVWCGSVWCVYVFCGMYVCVGPRLSCHSSQGSPLCKELAGLGALEQVARSPLSPQARRQQCRDRDGLVQGASKAECLSGGSKRKAA